MDAVGLLSRYSLLLFVIPAKAGIQKGPAGPWKNHSYSGWSRFWIPAFAGMTTKNGNAGRKQLASTDRIALV